MTQTRGHETLESRKMTISVMFKLTILISHSSEPLRSTKEQSVLLSSSRAHLLVEMTSASISSAQYLGDILIPCSALKMATAGVSFHSTYTVCLFPVRKCGRPYSQGKQPSGRPQRGPPPSSAPAQAAHSTLCPSLMNLSPLCAALRLFPREKRAKHSLAFNYMHLLQIMHVLINLKT